MYRELQPSSFHLEKKTPKYNHDSINDFTKQTFIHKRTPHHFAPYLRFVPDVEAGMIALIKIMTFVINKGNKISKSFGKSEIVLCAFPIIFQKFSIDV